MVHLLLSIVLFWFLTVFISQDHTIDLTTAAIWTFFSLALPTLFYTFVLYGLKLEPGLYTLLISIGLQVAVLGFALRFRFYITDRKQLATILVGFVVGSFVLGFIL